MVKPGAPKVVDFSSHLSGPMASHILSELGANVIRVEKPGSGDGNRGFPPLIKGMGMFHIALNSGARSLAIDSRSPHWNAVVAACAAWADAVIVGLHPEDAERRGLGAQLMFDRNPALIYCLITGYGEQGSWSRFTGHGLNMDAFAGMVPWEIVGEQVVVPEHYLSVGTTLAAVHAALGIMTALYWRAGDAKGRTVHVSSWGSAMWWNWRHLDTWASLGESWPAYKDLGSRYGTYITADRRALLLCPAERKFWHEFCDLAGFPPEWRQRGDWSGSGMDFGGSYEDERLEIARVIATDTMLGWTERLSQTRIPFAPLLNWSEALESPHATANRVMRSVMTESGVVPIARLPVDFGLQSNRTRAVADTMPLAKVGEHNREVLAEIGLANLTELT